MITCKPSHLNLEALSNHQLARGRSNVPSAHPNPALRTPCAAVSSSRRSNNSAGVCSVRNSNGSRGKKEGGVNGGGYCESGEWEGVERGGGGGGERKVNCEVEVISWRERRIRGEISVKAHVESVWNALTDYERLADFVPNLVCSGRIPCPHPGRIWLEQRGLQRALYWHIEARVVLDLQEFANSANKRELHFSMVDGDFKKFEGKWSLKSGPRSSTTLSYEVNVIPRFNFPAIFLERIIRSDLPVNLQALAFRAERNFEGNQELASTMSYRDRAINGAVTSIGPDLDNKVQPRDISTANAGQLPVSSTELTSNWGVFGKVCKLDRPCVVDEVHLRRLDGLLENGGVHRCVIASITVKAPVREVWNVLTSYESLPEIVPNLAISKILSRENNKVRILQEGCKGLLYMVLHARVVLDLCEHLEREISFEQVEGDFDAFQGKWIFEQLGNQHTLLKYTVESKMHKDSFLSEAIMEEGKPVDGVWYGTFIIRSLLKGAKASLLKAAFTFFLSKIRVIYEDLPSNLCAIRDYIENKGVTATDSETTGESRLFSEQTTSPSMDENTSLRATPEDFSKHDGDLSSERPRVPGLQRDIEVLKAEIVKFISEHGQEGFMPMRKQLRLHGRVDIEKAITRMGGFRRIASLMNLSLAYKDRKPKGYWDNLENLEEEVCRFQRSWGMDPSYMPSRKSFERAGRYDIARALEKWGGLHEVSRLLSLKVRHPNRQPGLAKDKRADDSVAATDVEVEDTSTSKPHVSQDTQKWLSQLEHLDINWVE